MSDLTLLFPEQKRIDIERVRKNILAARHGDVAPDAEEVLKSCVTFGESLLEDEGARAWPALQALGFWLRPRALEALMRTYFLSPSRTIRTARGIVFLVPPANVETLAAYLCVLSLLLGNITVVRLPLRRGEATDLWLSLMGKALARAPRSIRERLMILSYGHEDAFTDGISGLCDARLVWGGDETIRAFAVRPLPPHARAVGFGDRFSAAAINAGFYLKLDEEGRDALARSLAHDIAQFGQMACSSPRLLHWIGGHDETTAAASDFLPRVTAHMREKFGPPDPSEAMARLNAEFLALHDLNVAAQESVDPVLRVLRLADEEKGEALSAFKNIGYGHGLLLMDRLASLMELATRAEAKDQTLSHAGFEQATIDSFARACNGRGFDRLVPIGQALAFDVVWDGLNLVEIMSKIVRTKT